MSRTYSLKDVAAHSSKESPWFIIQDKVYDASKLLDEVCSRLSHLILNYDNA